MGLSSSSPFRRKVRVVAGLLLAAGLFMVLVTVQRRTRSPLPTASRIEAKGERRNSTSSTSEPGHASIGANATEHLHSRKPLICDDDDLPFKAPDFIVVRVNETVILAPTDWFSFR